MFYCVLVHEYFQYVFFQLTVSGDNGVTGLCVRDPVTVVQEQDNDNVTLHHRALVE